MNRIRGETPRPPMQSGRSIVGDGAKQLPRWPIGHLLSSYEFGGFAPHFLTAASRSGNGSGVTFSSDGMSSVLPWLSCTVSSSRIEAPRPPRARPLWQDLRVAPQICFIIMSPWTHGLENPVPHPVSLEWKIRFDSGPLVMQSQGFDPGSLLCKTLGSTRELRG